MQKQNHVKEHDIDHAKRQPHLGIANRKLAVVAGQSLRLFKRRECRVFFADKVNWLGESRWMLKYVAGSRLSAPIRINFMGGMKECATAPCGDVLNQIGITCGLKLGIPFQLFIGWMTQLL